MAIFALASGLSYVQVGKHGLIIQTTCISLYLAHREIFHTKVGKGGIKCKTRKQNNHHAVSSQIAYLDWGPQGVWGSGKKSYLFSRRGALCHNFRRASEQAHTLGE